jgi:tRNA (cmo5U34)-methyltransferase
MFNSDNATPHTASTYDTQVPKTIPYYDNFHEETLNLIKAMHLQPKNWLDTGCGTGTLAEKALKQFPSTRFVLVDPSPQMLKEAKEKLAGYANVTFLEAAPTQKLSALKEKFDVITAIQSHHYSTVPQRAEATKVCFNLLSPKGVYVTFENIHPFTEQGTSIGLENWKSRQIQAGREPKTAEEHMKRFGVEYFPITVEEHLALLRKTGFSAVELLWYSVMQAGFYCVK